MTDALKLLDPAKAAKVTLFSSPLIPNAIRPLFSKAMFHPSRRAWLG
jgi:hypothetical protein